MSDPEKITLGGHEVVLEDLSSPPPAQTGEPLEEVFFLGKGRCPYVPCGRSGYHRHFISGLSKAPRG